MKKLIFLRSRKSLDGCRLFKYSDKLFLVCGDYLKVINSIIKLWNDGVNPKSYLSEISRDINKDKSWVYEVVNKLMKNKIISKSINDGYKKKAMYRLSKNIEEGDINQNFETKDYRFFDIVLLLSVLLIDYLAIIRSDNTLLIIWSIMLPLIELVLHFR